MEKRKAYDLIYLGLIIRHLQSVEDSYEVSTCIEFLDELEGYLDKSGLPVSLNAFIKFLNPIRVKLKKRFLSNKIGSKIKKELMKDMNTLENVVFSEATIHKVYTIPKRRYNSEFLDIKPMELLNKGVFERLPEMAVFDFTSSCRCLLYGEGTASAFHILRTTEEVLKHFYFKYKKTKRLKKPMWGPMTKELRNKKTNRPEKTVMDSLDLVRNSYRNPTQHPEIKYDIESAQDLFGLCIDLINKMAIELETR